MDHGISELCILCKKLLIAEIMGKNSNLIFANEDGRIITALINAKAENPVIVLDEIDKMSNNFRGDPTSALLEVLDPEQNKYFRDNFMEIPIDLSDVLFIATANSYSSIPLPLLDRMEIIHVDSYLTYEKFNIAKDYLIKKDKHNHLFVVHRIDRETSGVLMFCKNEKIREYFSKSKRSGGKKK